MLKTCLMPTPIIVKFIPLPENRMWSWVNKSTLYSDIHIPPTSETSKCGGFRNEVPRNGGGMKKNQHITEQIHLDHLNRYRLQRHDNAEIPSVRIIARVCRQISKSRCRWEPCIKGGGVQDPRGREAVVETSAELCIMSTETAESCCP